MDSLEVKGIVEGALLSGISVLLVIFSFLFPLLGNLFLLISPVPIIILNVRWGSKISITSSLVVGIIIGSLIGPIVGLFSLFTLGLIGISIGSAIEENFSPKVIFLIGAIASSVSFLIVIFVSMYILNIDLLDQIKEVFQTSLDMYREMGIAEGRIEEVAQIMEMMLDIIRVAFLSLVFCMGMFISGVNYYFSTLILRRIGYDYQFNFSFRRLRFSKWLAYIYIVSLFIISTNVGKNIFIISNFLVLVQGLGVFYYYLLKFNFKKIVILFILLIMLLIPLINHSLLVLGFLDIWIDFRSLEKS